MNRISSYELYKRNIKWDKDNGYYTFHFRDDRLPLGRVNRRSKLWTRSRKSLAEDALREICDQMDEGTITRSSRIEFVVDNFLLFRKASGISPNTIRTNTHILDNHIIPNFAGRNINSITPLEMNTFLSKLPTKTYIDGDNNVLYSSSFIKKIQSHLNLLFKFATVNEYCHRNIMEAVYTVKRYEVEPIKKAVKITLSDVEKVLEKLDHIEDRLALNIAMWNIMRPSEIFGLNFSHDLGDKLYICQAWNDTDKVLGPVKNNKPRYSPITPPFRKILDDYYAYLKDHGIPYTPDSPLIRITGRMPTSTIRNRMRKAIEDAGVPHFAWMDVRRSVITELLALGNKPYIVAKNAGHQETMTTDVYAQVDIADQALAMETLVASRAEEKEIL